MTSTSRGTGCFLARPGTVTPEWHLVDADGQVVGRLAVKLATILMGKHKPTYTPHVDCGDFVVVVNAAKVRFGTRKVAHKTIPNFTKKMATKTYTHYTGYPGGQKVITAEDLITRRPEEILLMAVKRMLPKSKLGRNMLKKLKVYRDDQHPHQAQVPQPLTP